jgi:HEAT repeat protein
MEEMEVMVRVEMEELFQDMSLEVEEVEAHLLEVEEGSMGLLSMEDQAAAAAIIQLHRLPLSEVRAAVAVALGEILAQVARVEVLELAPGHLEDMEVGEVRDMEAELVFMVAVEEAILRMKVLARAVLEEEEEAVVMDREEGQAPLAAAAALARVRAATVQEDQRARMPWIRKAAMEPL